MMTVDRDIANYIIYYELPINGEKITRLEKEMEELIGNTIYHGRYFSKTMDRFVIKKSVDYIITKILNLVDDKNNI